jgi:hypothetical protein
VTDVSQLDGPSALTRKREVEARLGQLTKLDPEREALKAENQALDARLREVKEQTKAENMRRNFAGIGSPLHEALVERLPPAHVAELEAAALGKLADRERRSAEKKAAKTAGELLVDPPPIAPPRRQVPVVEVLRRRP